MAYTYTHPHGLGLDFGEIIRRGGSAISAASKVVQDPALPEITCHVLRLNKMAEGKPPGLPCPRPSYTGKGGGIGLALAVVPLRAVVWARENPVLAGAAGLAAVGALVGLGYYWGKKQK